VPGTTEPRLTKSKFISGLQCTKMLWWLVHEPDAEELEVDPAQQFLFDRGHEVGRVAQTYVPGGVLIDVPHRERRRRLAATAEALRAGAKVLYEAAFEHKNVMVVADILERVRGGWNLIEVKSTTSVKDQHVPDVAVQAHVLRGAGLEVRRAELMHLKRECRHPDLSNLFERTDVTEEIEEIIDEVPAQIRAMKRALDGPLPVVDIGNHCREPYECAFLGRCWPEAPPYAVRTLYRLARSRRDQYESEGYRTILDLPRSEILTAIQERQRQAARTNAVVVEPGLRAALDDLEPPFAYLDFETVAPPIPVWKGCRPYDAVPVQLSVHTQVPVGARRRAAGGGLTHHEWLADGNGDPREALARKLIEFTRGARTILAYNASFERRCIQDLQEQLPRMAARLGAVLDRVEDLLPVVRDHVYHPRFAGSFGLKSVAPALVPGLSYDALEIAAGDAASRMLYVMMLKSEGMETAEKKRLRRDLLKYCRMDTEALVGLHRALGRLS
jgi:predicted RecB family nuclease